MSSEHHLCHRCKAEILATNAAAPLAPLLTSFSIDLPGRDARTELGRVRNHLQPFWGRLTVGDLNRRTIFLWHDAALSSAKMPPSKAARLLKLMTRFVNWLKDRELFSGDNPFTEKIRRSLGVELPPPNRGREWIKGPGLAQASAAQLPWPVDLMFEVSNHCGSSLGQICGLRVTDAEAAAKGFIRFRFKYRVPIEHKHRTQLPEPPVGAALLGRLRALAIERRLAGAGDEDFLFLKPDRSPAEKNWVEHLWDEGPRKKLGLRMTWNNATVDSFISQRIVEGEPIHAIAKWTGKTQQALLKSYGHLLPDYTPRRAA